MSRRPAVKALLATAAVSAATILGFGALSQPSAAGASATPADCVTILIIPLCGSSSSAPTTSTPTPTSSTPTPTPDPTSTTSSPAAGSSSGTSSPSASSSSGATTAAKPSPAVNVSLSNLRILQQGRNLVVRFTVTNTGTLAVGGYLITAHAAGYPARAWLSNLPVGQPVQVSTTWPVRHHHTVVQVVVKGDPRHQVKESDESDNLLVGSKRVR